MERAIFLPRFLTSDKNEIRFICSLQLFFLLHLSFLLIYDGHVFVDTARRLFGRYRVRGADTGQRKRNLAGYDRLSYWRLHLRAHHVQSEYSTPAMCDFVKGFSRL